MNWEERVFLAYQMKVLKHFPDKLFQMTIAEIADLLVPIESKFEGGKGNERRTGEAFFPNKAVPVLWPRAPSKILQSSFHLEKLVLVNHFPHETAFRHKPYGGKEALLFRPFFLPQQAVVSKARAQSW